MTPKASIRQRPGYNDQGLFDKSLSQDKRTGTNGSTENRLGDDFHPVLRRVLLARGITRPEELMLDLCYREDFRAQVDFNVVLTDRGEMVELQGATEAEPFPKQRVAEVLALASRGVEPLFRAQREAIRQI